MGTLPGPHRHRRAPPAPRRCSCASRERRVSFTARPRRTTTWGTPLHGYPRTGVIGRRVRGPYRIVYKTRGSRPIRTDIPARRGTSRLSTPGGSPYSRALRNKSARLRPCSKQSRLSSLSSDPANRKLTRCRYDSQSGPWIGREPNTRNTRANNQRQGNPGPAGRRPYPGREPAAAQRGAEQNSRTPPVPDTEATSGSDVGPESPHRKPQ